MVLLDIDKNAIKILKTIYHNPKDIKLIEETVHIEHSLFKNYIAMLEVNKYISAISIKPLKYIDTAKGNGIFEKHRNECIDKWITRIIAIAALVISIFKP